MIGYLKGLLFNFIVNCIASSVLTPKFLRNFLYRFARIDTHAEWIKAKCYMSSNCVTIGKGSKINSYSKFYSFPNKNGNISIGENCYIGMNTLFFTNTHEISDFKCRAGESKFGSITVGDGCWIGANVIVLPGVIIGDGCIIAAGAVVNKKCEPNGMYAGVPARRKKDLK